MASSIDNKNNNSHRFEAQLKLICAQMLMGAFGSIMLGIYGVYLYWDEQYQLPMLLWLSTLTVLCLSYYLYSAKAAGYTDKKAFDALNNFSLLALLSGVIWSIPVIYIITGTIDNSLHDFWVFFLIICLIGMSAASLGSTSAYLPMFYCYNLIAASTLIITCFITLTPTLPLTEIAVVLLIFMSAMFWYAHKINSGLIEAIDLRNENLILAEKYQDEKNKAEESSQDKSKFLTAASHDLRQPLQSLTLFSEVLNSKLDSQENKSILKKMNSSIDVLNTLFSSIIDVSRLDSGNVLVKKSDVMIGELLKKLCDTYSSQAISKNITLSFVQTNLTVRTDPILLQRCLSNLIINAITHSEASKIVLAVKRDSALVKIIIIDNGIGIPQNEKTNIFNELYQLNNPERDKNKGLGLGLAIVKRTVTLLEHPITIDSTINKGTSFSIEIPRVLLPNKSMPTTFINSVGCTDKNILVIDDDADVREGMSLLLTTWNLRVTAASGKKDVISLLESGYQPDAIISDYRLPEDVNGVQLITLIRETIKHHIPAMIVTGDTKPTMLNGEDLDQLLLLQKPLAPVKLRAALNKILLSV